MTHKEIFATYRLIKIGSIVCNAGGRLRAWDRAKLSPIMLPSVHEK